MIEVCNLTKSYGNVEAVKDVSFTVGKEQILGFLGPNGAGKTTIMKILTGYHFPSGGKAVVDGIDLEDDPVEVKKRIGYLPEGVPLYGELTVEEYLGFMAGVRQVSGKNRKKAIDSSIEACGLGSMRKRRIDTLSKGYRQRTGLAQSILHDPPILILDEPTTGLDPNQIIEIRSLIRELGKRKTVILSTHILQEVEAIATQVLILNDGRIAAQGSPDEIAGGMKGEDTWELCLKGADTRSVLEKCGRLGIDNTVSPLPGWEETPDRVWISVRVPGGQGDAAAEYIFDWVVREGLRIFSMNLKRLSLEDIFVRLTSEQDSGGEGGK
jgi:ABC-2 type transport system ATP-binding protein